KRDGVLGDIVNSSPTWVGGPGAPYTNAGNDLLRNTNIAEFGTSYTNFSTTYQNRTNIVYVGANDGLLHGFRSNSPNDGNEMLAYMP
ncbi:PilC/PilY family type IV pilus protein, partial [Acinetobacter baumannii]